MPILTIKLAGAERGVKVDLPNGDSFTIEVVRPAQGQVSLRFVAPKEVRFSRFAQEERHDDL